jgi:hypothetical protein
MTVPVGRKQVVIVVKINVEILEECLFQFFADCGIIFVQQCCCFIRILVYADIMVIFGWDMKTILTSVEMSLKLP